MKYLTILSLILMILFVGSLSFAGHGGGRYYHNGGDNHRYNDAAFALGTVAAVQGIILNSMAIQNGGYNTIVQSPVIVEQPYYYAPRPHYRSYRYSTPYHNRPYHGSDRGYHHGGGPYYGGNGRMYYDRPRH